MSDFWLYQGDCVDVLRSWPEASVDAVVCDPPYGLEFMGKEWDAPWRARGVNPASAKFTAGGFKENNGYAGRQTPTYGKAWTNKRCKLCGHIASGGSPCTCDAPEWEIERGDTAAPLRAFQAWAETWAREVLRVLKPGGHLLAFGGTRTYHRLACAIEDAGFEVRDSIHWIYGSGFPKSLDVSKAIDKAAGAEREVLGTRDYRSAFNSSGTHQAFEGETHAAPVPITAPASDAARQWEGWGTALKPAHEPIILARKPLDGTVAANVQKWGTGALNIDGCRITVSAEDNIHAKNPHTQGGFGHGNAAVYGDSAGAPTYDPAKGRWPANVMFDEAAAAELDAQSGISKSTGGAGAASRGGMGKRVFGEYALDRNGQNAGGLGDSGGASRFFYVAKPSRRERDHGLDAFPARSGGEATDREDGTAGLSSPRAGAGRTGGSRNVHPTVKPVALMRELCRLVTPPGGIVLDPFVGSGTTGMAARLEGFRFVGIDQSAEYLAIAHARISAALSLK